MSKQLTAIKQALETLINLQPILGNGLLTDAQLKFIDPHIYSAIMKLRQAIKQPKKQECETCAAKRKRLIDAGFLKSPLRGEDHVD